MQVKWPGNQTLGILIVLFGLAIAMAVPVAWLLMQEPPGQQIATAIVLTLMSIYVGLSIISMGAAIAATFYLQNTTIKIENALGTRAFDVIECELKPQYRTFATYLVPDFGRFFWVRAKDGRVLMIENRASEGIAFRSAMELALVNSIAKNDSELKSPPEGSVDV